MPSNSHIHKALHTYIEKLASGLSYPSITRQMRLAAVKTKKTTPL